MAIKICLTWDRNPDSRTKRYRIYRSTGPKVTRNNLLIAEIKQPEDAQPVPIVNERLVKVDDYTYQVVHKNIFSDSVLTPIHIYRAGVELAKTDYAVSTDEGLIVVSQMFAEDDVLTMSYFFDGIRFYDTEEAQTGVTYYGPKPESKIEPLPPQDVLLTSDPENNRAVLTWSLTENRVVGYYYRIEAIDNEGRYSNLSPEHAAFIYSKLGDPPNIVECSPNGEANWSVIAKPTKNIFIVSNLDKEPPDPPTLFKAAVTLYQNQGKSDVNLTWINPTQDRGIPSLYYRIRAISENGIVSLPSARTAPVIVQTGLDSLVLRRKVYDGSLPLPDGSDGSTLLATFDDFDTQSYADLNLSDGVKYTYAIYTKDLAGNYSIAAVATTDVGDATPPAKITTATIKRNEL